MSISQIQFEEINLSHTPLLKDKKVSRLLSEYGFDVSSIILNNFNNSLPVPFISKRIYAYLAIEKNTIIAFVILNSFNISSTTFFIKEPVIIYEPNNITTRQLTLLLLKEAIASINILTPNFLIKCSIANDNLISITRELGFQPFNKYYRWNLLDEETSFSAIEDPLKKFEIIEFQKVTKFNIYEIIKLDNIFDSSHLRQIMDLSSNDYLRKMYNNRILFCTKFTNQICLAALIYVESSDSKKLIRLVRNTNLDFKLNQFVPILLTSILKDHTDIDLETVFDDIQINSYLKDLGFKYRNESVLLGKTSWKRKEMHSIIKDKSNLNSVLTKISPQRPPLPSPIYTEEL